MTWFRDNVRRLRPLYRRPDPADRLTWEAGDAAQCDLWFPPMKIPLENGKSSLLPVLVNATLGVDPVSLAQTPSVATAVLAYAEQVKSIPEGGAPKSSLNAAIFIPTVLPGVLPEVDPTELEHAERTACPT